MRIAMLGAYPVYGWAQELDIDPVTFKRITSWNETLAIALSKIEGAEVHFITSTKAIPKTKTVARGNLKVTFFVSPPRFNMCTLFEYTRFHVQKIFNEFQPDIVHGIGTEHIWPYIALRSGYPNVVTVHGIMSEINRKIPSPFLSKKAFFGWLEKQVLKKTEHLITINPYVGDVLGQYTVAQRHFIENPVSEIYFNSKAKFEFWEDILYVGTIEPRKDQCTLIEAFDIVLKRMGKMNRAKLKVVGPTNVQDYFDKIKKLVMEKGFENRVQFKGFVLPDELVRLYESAGLLVLSSIEETAPMCIAEAMSCGLPIVSTDAGGIKHMIREGETGFVVPQRDPNSLADAMMKLLNDPERRRKMGAAAKEDAEKRFRSDKIAEKTLNVYKRILNERS